MNPATDERTKQKSTNNLKKPCL